MAEPIRLRARSIGPFAARALRASEQGAVVAVFERSVYARFGEQSICIGGAELWDGPLNAVCAGSPPAGFSSLALGDRICLARPISTAADCRVTIDVSHADAWWPARPVKNDLVAGFPPGFRNRLRDGLEAVIRALPQPPADGLGGLLGGVGTPLARAVGSSAEHIAAVIRGEAAPARERIAPLLGLGPGLTPSGDDYLGGVLIALHAVGRDAEAERIWSVIQYVTPSATNDISAAHLVAAAQGFGSAPLHALLTAIIGGERDQRLADLAAAVIRIGHTSGWDALAGAFMAIRTLCTEENYCAAST